MEYSVILTPEPEGGFTIAIPVFPEYVGFAETEEEAAALAREGIAFELERLREEGKPAPTESGTPKVLLVAA
jgi:predicted RNase H-like HicB family nuclease